MGYSAFLDTRDGGLRATIRRRTRRFMALPGAGITVATEGPALEAALAAYLALHARSWKPAEPFPDFVPSFARRFARRGMLRIGVAATDGRPVAAQIWIVWRRRATIAKLAHDEAARDLSPGTVLTAAMIRDALDAGDLDEIDFGRGDDPYKRLWLPRRRPMMALMAGNCRSARGAVAALRHLVPHAVRRAAAALDALARRR
jgi:CelD/BcsL family acetyltransferase involved in cellulose biosynthesis